MAYWQVLAIFIVPPTLVLLWATRHLMDRRAWLAVLAIMALAVVYTTPWDSYIISRGVWFYDDERMLGIYYWRVPIEEYTFFLLQTLLTGLFTVWLLRRHGAKAE